MRLFPEMQRLLFFLFLFLAGYPLSAVRGADFQVEEQPAAGEYVVLIHGLDWFRDTLQPTADFLHKNGYHTLNVRYPSRHVRDVAAASVWVDQVITEHCADPSKRINFVAHSMGAIVLRNLLASPHSWQTGRVVLMGAPNQGTPLCDTLKWKPLRKIMGSAAALLIPGADGLCCRLGAATFSPGVLMGSRAGRFAVFSPFIPGEDDGVIPVSSGRIEGMADFRVLPVSHLMLPRNPAVLAETLTFLQMGHFSVPAAEALPSSGKRRLLSFR